MLQLKDQHITNQPDPTPTETQSSSTPLTADDVSTGPLLTQSSQTLNPDIHSTITTIRLEPIML